MIYRFLKQNSKASHDVMHIIFNINVYIRCSAGKPTGGGPLAWDFGEGLIIPHREKPACYELLCSALDLCGIL
jgi:hypothetical protein